jgi:hypothetical protein
MHQIDQKLPNCTEKERTKHSIHAALRLVPEKPALHKLIAASDRLNSAFN